MRLTVATERYDRTAALHDGRVVPEGLEVTWLQLNPEQLFWRMIQHREFDASEMALASFLILRDRGDDDFVGIPAFLSRSFSVHAPEYRSGDAQCNKHCLRERGLQTDPSRRIMAAQGNDPVPKNCKGC